MLSRLTDEGRKTVKMRPERIKEVNIEIEKMGAKVLEQYAVLGEYDFVNILEAPDNETISRVSIELGARGTIQLITLAAISIDELAEHYLHQALFINNIFCSYLPALVFALFIAFELILLYKFPLFNNFKIAFLKDEMNLGQQE